jgi:hypothetical protein
MLRKGRYTFNKKVIITKSVQLIGIEDGVEINTGEFDWICIWFPSDTKKMFSKWTWIVCSMSMSNASICLGGPHTQNAVPVFISTPSSIPISWTLLVIITFL